MLDKEEFCFRVMRKFGILVNFEGDCSKANVASALEENESIAKWSKRVLGAEVRDVSIYVPIRIDGKRKIANLQREVDSEHLRAVVKAHAKVKDASADVKKGKAVEKAEKLFSTFSKDTLKDYLHEFDSELEPSVEEFLTRQINESPDEIEAEELIKKLLKQFNNVAGAYRILKYKSESSNST